MEEVMDLWVMKDAEESPSVWRWVSAEQEEPKAVKLLNAGSRKKDIAKKQNKTKHTPFQ